MHHVQGCGRVALVAGALAALGLWAGCGQPECGKGTVEVDGECRAGVPLECGPGFTALDGECVPFIGGPPGCYEASCCDPATTEWDPFTQTCRSTIPPPDRFGPCSQRCLPVSGSTVCLSGRVFQAPSLMASWAWDGCQPTPVTNQDGAVVKVYDPIDLVTNPAPSKPLAEAAIDKDGCFVAPGVTIPFTGFVALGVDDSSATAGKWVLTGTGVTLAPGQNSTGLKLPAVSEQVAAAWGHELVSRGAMVAVFQDTLGGGVDGVTVSSSGSRPLETVYFKETASCGVTIDPTATATGQTGAVAIRGAQTVSYSGTKSGCFIQSGLGGGSAPGMLFFSFFEVTGC